jgi:hemoglobin-like flavoprotein
MEPAATDHPHSSGGGVCPFPHAVKAASEAEVARARAPEQRPTEEPQTKDGFCDHRLSQQDKILIKEAHNKVGAWQTMVAEAWAQRMLQDRPDLMDKYPEHFPAIEDELWGILDVAVRAVDLTTEVPSREIFRPFHAASGRRSFFDFARYFWVLFDDSLWLVCKRAWLWAMSTHGVYLEERHRADLELGEDGRLAKFFQWCIVERVQAVARTHLDVTTAEISALIEYWSETGSLKSEFGVVFYSSLFQEHPSVQSFFSKVNMDKQSVHLFEVVDIAIKSFADFLSLLPALRKLGQTHAARSVPVAAYPIVVALVVRCLAALKPMPLAVRTALEKALYKVSVIIEQLARNRELMLHDAQKFLRQMAQELEWSSEQLSARLVTVSESIQQSGFYEHTTAEIEYGARVAWRNSAKCVGRISWNLLTLRDARHVTTGAQFFKECIDHLALATGKANMEAVLTMFPARRPGQRWGWRVWNSQLVRFAGYVMPDKSVLGDPANVSLTERIIRLGWTPPETKGMFDVLPVVLEIEEHPEPYLYQFPASSTLLVDITHPDKIEFADLGLRWCAVPTISCFNLRLVVF